LVNWDPILASARRVELAGVLLRLVESQEQIATNALVGSLERQAILEDLLEATKPPLRRGTEHLHYLLAAPFRYPPLKYGSRFGTRHEPSLFYGSAAVRTVLAEAAYYRLVFWAGMATPPTGKLDTQHTLFGAAYKSALGLRLQNPPFDVHRALLQSRNDYGSSQALGSCMRAAGIEVIEFLSARDADNGINLALFTPQAIAEKTDPLSLQAWLCETTAERVRFSKIHGKSTYEFSREAFRVGDSVPPPA
jgi:hypothetical protein